jgi:hypothetical protein
LGRQSLLWFVCAVFEVFLVVACHANRGIDGRDPSVIQQPSKATETVPLSVETVETFGFWSEGKAEGSYRLVLLQKGYEHLSHRLIIQWIEISQEVGRVLAEQIEPNLGKATGSTGYAIAVTKIESSESGGATVHLDLVHPISMARQSVALNLGEPGVCESVWGSAAGSSE